MSKILAFRAATAARPDLTAPTERPTPAVRPHIPPALAESRARYLLQATLSAIALAILSPALLLIALAVKLTSPGPVLYRGVRVGRGQKLYTMYKFRTLRDGSERQIGGRLLSPQDNFYTPIGKFLKRSKLDEIPQLINVLRGDMNFAGPRPLRPIFLERYLGEIPHYAERFRVAPGMTGLAQVRGGYFTSPHNKLRYDRLYITHRTLWLDVELVALTALKVLNRWLTLGAFLLVLLLFLSFIPAETQERLYVTMGGAKVNPLHGLLAFGALWMILRRAPSDRISIYRTPLNLPIASFLLLSLVSAALAADSAAQVQAVRGAAYYLITGFLILLAIVNGTFTRSFVRSAVSAIALTSVAISCVGILELILADYVAPAHIGGTVRTGLGLTQVGISSTLGSPIALATYLLLGIPCVLCSLSRAHTREGRDFWVAAATICLVGILLTRHPAGLISLGVISAVYLWRQFNGLWALVFLAVISPLVALAMIHDASGGGMQWSQVLCGDGAGCQTIASLTPRELLLGIGSRTLGQLKPLGGRLTDQILAGANGNVRLIIENGLLGWATMLWILGASLRVLYKAQHRVSDPGLRAVLWAVIAAVLGFLAAMQTFDPFNNIAIQLLFWGLLGIGIGVVVRLGERPSDYRIALKLGH